MARKFTFLKVDIVEHSKLVAFEPPYVVRPILDKFLDFVQTTTKNHGGTLWNWQGDGGLCAFPAGRELQNVNAGLEAALEILRGVSPFWVSDDREPFPEAKTKFKIRIAAHLGDAEIQKDLGRVHSPDINLVAHLERVAPPNSIVATQRVIRCCNRDIQRLFTPTPDQFEGEPISICDLYGPKHLQTWDKVLQGIGILLRAIHARAFRPDLVIGCTRSGGIIGAMLAGHLGQQSFVVLNRRDKGTQARRSIVFDDLAILNDEKTLPRNSRLLLCFYQVQSGETERAFCSYLSGAGFNNLLVATLFLDARGKDEMTRVGLQHVSAYDSVPDWGDTPWKLSDAWKWV